MLGTNGGGFFNANSAHPFENPTPLSNLLQMLAIFVIPGGPDGDAGSADWLAGHGWAVLATMFLLFAVGFSVVYWSESRPHPLIHGAAQTLGYVAGRQHGRQGSAFRHSAEFAVCNRYDGCKLRCSEWHA